MTPANMTLDRAAHLRQDAGRLAKLRADPAARFLVLVEGKPVIQSNPARTRTSIRWLAANELARTGTPFDDGAIFLGLASGTGTGRFACTVSEQIAGQHEAHFKPAVDFRSLVTQGTMPDAEMDVIATAKSLAHWHERSRYCGSCGAPTAGVDGGWKRVCGGCSAEWFPRVDPVVIMLVTDGERAVLAREPHFPPGLYSALAGFIEPGEGIEQAVIRETAEEVGLMVERVELVANQPWPTPHSLMLGCMARVAPGASLRIDPTEIEDARWFTREEVQALLDGTDPSGRYVPPRQAIAHQLMTGWMGK